MVSHTCSQVKVIESLTNKTQSLMDLVKNTNDKVEKIYSYIFEGKMEEKYSTKEEVVQANTLQEEKNKQMKANIDKHSKVIDKLAWAVIIGVLVFIGTSVVNLLKK